MEQVSSNWNNRLDLNVTTCVKQTAHSSLVKESRKRENINPSKRKILLNTLCDELKVQHEKLFTHILLSELLLYFRCKYLNKESSVTWRTVQMTAYDVLLLPITYLATFTISIHMFCSGLYYRVVVVR